MRRVPEAKQEMKSALLALSILFCSIFDAYTGSPKFIQHDIFDSSHGTLVVGLATPKFIVVASDSRRTSGSGQFNDQSKKIFVLSGKRIIGIAGLSDASVPGAPWITAQIAPLFDQAAAFYGGGDFDALHWNNDFPPPGVSTFEQSRWDEVDNYAWSGQILGPVQTIANIYATFGEVCPEKLALQIMQAGFKDNGDAKIQLFTILPRLVTSSSGRPEVLSSAGLPDRAVTNNQLIWKVAGVGNLAAAVLGEHLSDDIRSFVNSYPGITAFLTRQQNKTVNHISENEMIALAEDLIRATSRLSPVVGESPIQLATVRPGEKVQLVQPTFPLPAVVLSSRGEWRLGETFDASFPFDSDDMHGGVVFTFCEIKDNTTPISLGENIFYGNDFVRATFIYKGGRVTFGPNNKVQDGKLIIEAGVDEGPLSGIRGYFSKIERTQSKK